jgi:2-dehydro-3-deoxygluconokinase
VSYDANYRPSLWQANGGQARAGEVNQMLAPYVDVMIGNQEDFSAALGMPASHRYDDHARLVPAQYRAMIENFNREFPNISVVATTLRQATSATRNDWSAIACGDGQFHEAVVRENMELYDRIGGGDAFAAGLIYGLLAGKDLSWAVECGAAHGALTMTTPGDSSMATLPEVLNVMQSRSAQITR